ncbi:hypothetical protein KFL_000010700 [Klebsormidium nitens]|uniref:Centrosomal protein of 70 kDa n=1 Tax=Klebsormidium nitens TaxID=105231 RepID=A0A0U9HR33_KLENI|nr:hypothetical protein KFL_000010700 [Klebsormidium nitens]|eukprot:GAQ77621.1 hypothetical protein KFL_000010700 [Klebsormidium nitens]
MSDSMEEPATPAATRGGVGSHGGSAMRGEDFTTFIKALTEKYGLFEKTSRIKPPQLSFDKTPQQSGRKHSPEGQLSSHAQGTVSIKDGVSIADVKSKTEGKPELSAGPPQTRRTGRIESPDLNATSKLDIPGLRLGVSDAMPGGHPAATAPHHLSDASQDPINHAMETQLSPSLSQSPTLPTSGSEASFTRHRASHRQAWHSKEPHEDSIDGNTDILSEPRGQANEASNTSALPSPSSPAGNTLAPFTRPVLYQDQASGQASSQPPLLPGRSPRRPPRWLPLLTSIEAEARLSDIGGGERMREPDAEATPGADGEASQADGTAPETMLEPSAASAETPHGGMLKRFQEASTSELEGSKASAGVSPPGDGGHSQAHDQESADDERERQAGSQPGGWSALNRSLRDNGFGSLRSPQEPGFFVDVHAVFKDLLKQYERRGAMVQELLGANESAKEAQSQQQADLQRLAHEKETLESKVEVLEHQAKEAAEGVDQAGANLAERIRKLESANASLQQRCSQLQHLARAKERTAQKLQDKLEETVLKEEKRRSREKDIYEKLKRKLASDARGRGWGDLGKAAAVAARELQPTVLVGLYEAQREATDAELSMLRKELAAVHAELRDKDNLIMRKDRAGGWKTLEVGVLLEKQMAAEKAASEEALALAALEASLAEKQQDANRRVADATKRAEQLAEENANLRLELEARPSVRDFRETQRLLSRLTRKIEDMRKQQGTWSDSDSEEDALEEAELDGAVARKQERLRPTRERIARDRNVHRLRLKKLDKLPKDVLLEALQDVCIQVEAAELSQLTSSVDKMLRVMAAVPKMERFISDVCSIVFLEGPPPNSSNGSNGQRSPDAVPSILRGWIETLGKVRELEEFQAVIATELGQRPEGRQTVQGPNLARNCAAAVKELVGLEREFLLKEATFRQAEGLVLADPERLIHKMLAHFQRLFEVPRLDGVFARINAVYSQYSEHHNFLRALRSLLGLPDNAGTGACIARIRALLDQDGRARALVPEYVLGEKRNGAAAGASASGRPAEEPTGDKVGRREVVNKLLRLFHQSDEKQLVAHCETILSRLQRHTQVLPRYQSVVNELYDLLRVATLDAIVPAVRALKHV